MVPERESSVQIVPYRYERGKWAVCREIRHLAPQLSTTPIKKNAWLVASQAVLRLWSGTLLDLTFVLGVGVENEISYAVLRLRINNRS